MNQQIQTTAATARHNYPQTDVAGTSTLSALPAWKQDFVKMRDKLIAEYRAHHLSLEEIGSTLKEMGVTLTGPTGIVMTTTRSNITRSRGRGVLKAGTTRANATQPTGKTLKVLNFIQAHPNTPVDAIVKGARVQRNYAHTVLGDLSKRGFIQRFGERGSYTYSAV